MPDVSRLSTKNRKALLGCVKSKATKWHEEHAGEEMSQETNQMHFTECSQALGLAKADAGPAPDQRKRREALRRCMAQRANEWMKQNPGKRATDMPQDTIAANKLECGKAVQKTVRPPQSVCDVAWEEADVDLSSGAPLTLQDVCYVHAMAKAGLPEYGGAETLRWSRRVLRAAGLMKAAPGGTLDVPEFVDLYLGPWVLAKLDPRPVDELAPAAEGPVVLLPVDEGTLVLTAADEPPATTPGGLVLQDVSWDEAAALGYSENKLRMVHKAAGGRTVGMHVAQVSDDCWLLTAPEERPLAKVDEELGLVFGWGAVSTINGEPYYDSQGDHITEDGLTKAAANFMLKYRDLSDMHEPDEDSEEDDEDGVVPIKKGAVVFCWPLTADVQKAFGITCDRTGLLVAVKPDPDVLEKFRSGEYTGFSIGGRYLPAFTEEVEV